jgi:hypothetical protein
MSNVRVLVGNRKGAFILTSDGKREKWDVSGPHFAGWELYHLKGSPEDPNRLYASQSSGWFGQVIQRSDDGGKTWFQPGTPVGEPTTTPEGMPLGESNKFVYDTSSETGKPLTTHQWYDGTAHPWEFKRVWHLEPSLTTQTPFMPALKMPRCSNQPTAAKRGKNLPDYAATAPAPSGNRALAVCACTRSFWIQRIENGSSWPSRQRVHSAVTTAAQPGNQSIRACTHNTFPIRLQRWATVFITWQCILQIRICCLCRSIGTFCAVTMEVIRGKRSAVICRPISDL